MSTPSMPVTGQAPDVRGETTPRQMIGVLWKQRRSLYVLTPLFIAVAAYLAWDTSHTYKAYMTLAVVLESRNSSPGGGGLGAIASQFGGLASLAGLSSEEPKKWESIAVLQSAALTKRYIQTNDLLPILYASRWDAARGAWRHSIFYQTPTLWLADQYFKRKVLAVTIDSKTGLVTLTVSWKNPQLAAAWANGLVKEANEYLRQQAIAQSERNIAYLTEQAQKSNIIEVKQAIFSTLQAEITTEMLATGNDQFAFKVIDPAVPPEKPSTFALWIWLCLGIAASLVAWILAAFLRIAWSG